MISNLASNPLADRMAWSSSSGGYINSVINYRAIVNGQTIKLRFRFGTDEDGSAGVECRHHLHRGRLLPISICRRDALRDRAYLLVLQASAGKRAISGCKRLAHRMDFADNSPVPHLRGICLAPTARLHFSLGQRPRNCAQA